MNEIQRSNIFQNPYYILILFSLLPVLNFVAFNFNELGFSVSRAGFYLLVILATAFIAHLLIRFLFSSISIIQSSLFVGLALLITFYGYLIDKFVFSSFLPQIGITPRIIYVGVLYLVSLFFCAVVAYLLGKRTNLVFILVIAFSASAITDIYTIVSAAGYQQKHPVKPAANTGTNPVAQPSSDIDSGNSDKKNVYFILPDMMFGPELFNKYGINSNILQGISARGFKIIERTYSNAPVTEFSLPHIFTMIHYLEDGDKISTSELNNITRSSAKNNRVVKEFTARGYTSYALSDGYIDMCSRGQYQCFKNRKGDKFLQQDLRFIERTPFFKILNVLDMRYNLFSSPLNLWPYPNRLELPELLPFIKQKKTEPYFFYIHLGLPHYPLRFDKNCNYKRFASTDVAYSEQYQCSVKYLELLIDEILILDDDPIIVIHSDHGVMIKNQHLKQVEELSEEEIVESLSIMSAFRVPNECEENLSTDITPVNTFRFVFSCLDGTKPNYVENRSFLVYYPKWPSGGQVREWFREQKSIQ